ncbi:MAG: FprA family A-type flavoprotein, partial [Bacteroidales bacterium]|nr:FprA family A-type flavoprotein [Bacteroidales bacterium]MDY6348599.1 FprA family A-type flavoprotein [Bacteroidales bacterium]
MNTSRLIKDNLWYIGASDRRLALFENMMPVPNGTSYNSYLLTDEKTALLDTVDQAVSAQFLENLTSVLGQRKLDYIVIHHVEPDHLASLTEVLVRYPEATIVCSLQASRLMKQFMDIPEDIKFQVVKEGDTLSIGKHTLNFVGAQMVHWPEVLVSYESTEKILFSADAFGTFGALGGNLFADEVEFDSEWMPEARRYYTNIVGKYGFQVQNLLKKASALDIAMICPLHGPVWRKDFAKFIEKYDLWSRYEPECREILIVYGSMYGHTESAAAVLAGLLADKGCRNIKMFDVSATHVSYIVSESFRCSHIILFAPTYNGGLYPPMENYLLDIKAHLLQNRTFTLIENGSWAPVSGNAVRNILAEMKNITILEPAITFKSSMKDTQRNELEALAETIVKSI